MKKEDSDRSGTEMFNLALINVFHLMAFLVLFYFVYDGIEVLDKKGWIFPATTDIKSLNHFLIKSGLIGFGAFYLQIIYMIFYDIQKTIFFENIEGFNIPRNPVYLFRVLLILAASASVGLLFYPIGIILLICFCFGMIIFAGFIFFFIFGPTLSSLANWVLKDETFAKMKKNEKKIIEWFVVELK